jgi:hypothetical protein
MADGHPERLDRRAAGPAVEDAGRLCSNRLFGFIRLMLESADTKTPA